MRQLFAYLLIVAVSIGSSVIVTDHNNSKNAALSIRLDSARHTALVKVCESNIADRLVLIRTTMVEAKANEAVGKAVTSSPDAQVIRAREAKVERAEIADLRSRVDPAHGGNIVCDTVK